MNKEIKKLYKIKDNKKINENLTFSMAIIFLISFLLTCSSFVLNWILNFYNFSVSINSQIKKIIIIILIITFILMLISSALLIYIIYRKDIKDEDSLIIIK